MADMTPERQDVAPDHAAAHDSLIRSGAQAVDYCVTMLGLERAEAIDRVGAVIVSLAHTLDEARDTIARLRDEAGE